MLTTSLLSLLSVAAALRAPASPPRNVAIVVFEGVELLDFAGPGEVFSAVHANNQMAFNVYTVAASTEPVVSQGFVHITPAYSYEDCPPPAIVVVPGGNVPLRDEGLRSFVEASAASGELVMSVCNGAGVLAAAGLLDGLEVTTHHSALEFVQTLAPTAKVLSNRRFVDNGKILTSAGVSAGIDGALHVVSRLHGADAARATARYMEYDWRPDEIAELHARPGERVEVSSSVQVLDLLEGRSVEEAVPVYRERAASDDGLAEQHVNRFGYTLLNSGRGAEALRVLQLVAAAYPSSANACDSVAEAYEVLERHEEAIQWSKRALELLDADASATVERKALIRRASSERIERLESGAKRTAWVCPPCGMDCDATRAAKAGDCTGCGMALVQAGASSR